MKIKKEIQKAPFEPVSFTITCDTPYDLLAMILAVNVSAADLIESDKPERITLSKETLDVVKTTWNKNNLKIYEAFYLEYLRQVQ